MVWFLANMLVTCHTDQYKLSTPLNLFFILFPSQHRQPQRRSSTPRHHGFYTPQQGPHQSGTTLFLTVCACPLPFTRISPSLPFKKAGRPGQKHASKKEKRPPTPRQLRNQAKQRTELAQLKGVFNILRITKNYFFVLTAWVCKLSVFLERRG